MPTQFTEADQPSDFHEPKPLSRLLRREAVAMVGNLAASLCLRGSALTSASYIDPRARLIGAKDLHIDGHCQIYAGVTLRAIGNRPAAIRLGRYVIVREGSFIDAHGGWIEIAEGSFVGQNAVIYGQGGVAIGENSLLSPGVTIISAQHTFDRADIPIKFQPETFSCVTIGSDCWLGAKVSVLAGVTIGDGTVVGAGAVVTRDLPSWVIAAGVPARVIRSRSP